MVKSKSWEGQAPDKYEAILGTQDVWTIYQVTSSLSKKTNQVWLSLKVVAGRRVPNKANYYLSFNVKERRLADNRDVRLLKAHRPDLYAWVSSVLDARAKQGPGATPPATQEPAAKPTVEDLF